MVTVSSGSSVARRTSHSAGFSAAASMPVRATASPLVNIGTHLLLQPELVVYCSCGTRSIVCATMYSFVTRGVSKGCLHLQRFETPARSTGREGRALDRLSSSGDNGQIRERTV